jgi:outer membrane protein OmpA-like peptidoglycan-associated protein
MERKRLSLLGKLALAGVAAAGPAIAQAGDGFYLGIGGGFNWAEDQDFKISGYEATLGPGLNPPPNGSVITEVEYDDDFMGALAFGYATGALRPEIELSYRSNDVHNQREHYRGPLGGESEADAANRGDSTLAYSAMANLWLDFFKSSSDIHPYIGGGVGGMKVKLKDPTYAGNEIDNDDDTLLAYQAGAGVAYAISDQMDISLDYRWIRSEKGKFDLLPDTSGTVKERYEAQSAMLTLRWYFAGPAEEAPAAPPPEPVNVVPVAEAPPPAEPPPPPPPPPPSCVAPAPGEPFDMQGCKTGDTIVLRGVNFEFNKSTLTANAKTILDMVGEALTKRTDIKVELDGHTDAKGSDAYNMKLSQRRAQTVRTYLVGKGIEAGRMTAVGMGESAPIADNETDEGRELNRRVELKVLESAGGVTTEPAAPAADAPAPTE